MFWNTMVSRFNKIYNSIMLKRKKICFNENAIINGRIHIYGTGNITIGSGSTINSSTLSNPTGGFPYTILYTEHKGEIFIGNNVGISNSVICSFDNICIEDDAMIGAGTCIYDSDFHPIDFESRNSNKIDGILSSPVIIGKGSFIGAHTMVLKGVEIGKYSVVGAGSVVTKSIPDGEIWAGNPARFIRKIGK